MGANVPGKPRVSRPTSAAAYRAKCSEAADGYSFALTMLPRERRQPDAIPSPVPSPSP